MPASGTTRFEIGRPGGVVRLVAGLLAVWTPVAVAQSDAGPGPHARPSLYANVEAVVPGKAFEVAIRFELDEEWHIYWKNPGQSGRRPFVAWELPAGFTAGPLRFPAPRRYVDAGDITTFILEGSPTLLATVTPPETWAGGTARLVAKLDWLVCKESCFLEDKTLTLELPSAPAGSRAKPANEDIFKRAQRGLPLERSQRGVKIAASVEGFKPVKGATFDMLLNVSVPKGLHIQSNTPTEDWYIGADTILERTDGIRFDDPVYPEPHLREARFLGKVSEFSGEITVRIPATVESAELASPLRFAGLFRMQACSTGGQCYAPEMVAFETSVTFEAQANATPPAADQGGRQTLSAAERSPDDDGTAEALPDTSGDNGDDGDQQTAATVPATSPPRPPSAGPERSLVVYILFGFLGGLILNIMPCVLPVISIKVLSFVQQAGEDRGRVLRLGLAFSAGIMVWFWGFAAISILGSPPLQNPNVIVALTAVMFVFGLSLFGVFEINLPGRATTSLAGAAEREGYTGAFMKGLLATILGTACTAPLLAPALAWATAQPPLLAFIVFSAAGLGMASPYLVLSAAPGWMRYLPRPGNWMITFKQAMGFLLIGTAVWLLSVLGDQWYEGGVVWTVAFLSFLALACWLIGKIDINWPVSSQLATWAVALAIAGGGWFFCYRVKFDPEEAVAARRALLAGGGDAAIDALNWDDGIPWQPYQAGKPEELARQGYTVYVDYTATWCLTCQANKKLVLETDGIRKRMAELGVIPIKADYTNADPDIEEDLRRFGRSAVPLNIIVPACDPDAVQVLPVVLTANIVNTELDKAGPSHEEACS